MISQLIYTSAPSGLSPGSSGYCTVQSSRGIPAPTVDLLESLSGYRHLFTPGSPEAKRNPVNYGHYILRISGKKEHVLSRVSDCDLDHTGRSNKLAHHMIVSDNSSVKSGPAWLLQQPGWMVDRWDGEVKLIDAAPALPTQSRPVSKCTTWESECGDAGWAGVMAQAFLDDPQRKVFLVYQPGTDVLALFEEAISLLPENRRWDVTFSTYAAALPSTVDCLWTGITADSQEVHLSKRFVNAMRIELPTLSGNAPAGLLVDVARTGKVSNKPVTPPAPPKEKTAVSPVTKEPQLEADTYQIADPQPTSTTTPNLPPSIPLKKKPNKQSSLKRYLVLLTILCFIAGGGAYAYINSQNAQKAQLLAELDKEHAPEIPEEVSPSITTEYLLPDPDPSQQNISKPTAEPPKPSMKEEPEHDSTPPTQTKNPKTPPTEIPDPILAVEKHDNKNVHVEYVTVRPSFVKQDEAILKFKKGWDDNLGGFKEMKILFPVLKPGATNLVSTDKIKVVPKAPRKEIIGIENDFGGRENKTYQCYEFTVIQDIQDIQEIYSVKVLIREEDSGIEIRTMALVSLNKDIKPILQRIALLIRAEKQSTLLSLSNYYSCKTMKFNKKLKSFTHRIPDSSQFVKDLHLMADKYSLVASPEATLASEDKFIGYKKNPNNTYIPVDKGMQTGNMTYAFEAEHSPANSGDGGHTQLKLMKYYPGLEYSKINEKRKSNKNNIGMIESTFKKMKTALDLDTEINVAPSDYDEIKKDTSEVMLDSLSHAIERIKGKVRMFSEKRINAINGMDTDEKSIKKQKIRDTEQEYLSALDNRLQFSKNRIALQNEEKEIDERRLTGLTISYEVGPLKGEGDRHRIDLIRIDDSTSE